MKKFMSLVLALMMVFTIVGCGAEKSSQIQKSSNHDENTVEAEIANVENKKVVTEDTSDGEIWGEMQQNGFSDSGEDEQPNLAIKPNLEGFQYAKNPNLYEAPQNGEYVMTDSLKAAVEKYGNQVTYRIHLDIYEGQNKLDSNCTEVQEWFNELNPDITVTYLDSYDGTAHSYDFYMDVCSYEDLMAFCNIESEYGVILSLYCESNGDFSEQIQTSPQIFNSPDVVD